MPGTFHSEQYPPVKIISVLNENGRTQPGMLIDSLVGGGCIIEGARVEGSVLSPNVRVQKNVSISGSVIMNNVVICENAKIQNAIIDKDVTIPPDAQIGYDLSLDRKRFDVTSSGIVIVAKKTAVK